MTETLKACERKHFLLRAINFKTKTKEECAEELAQLDKEINIAVAKRLADMRVKLKDEVEQIKSQPFSDGDLKRAVAKLMLKFLDPFFTNEELKGICRQGYKIMRGRC